MLGGEGQNITFSISFFSAFLIPGNIINRREHSDTEAKRLFQVFLLTLKEGNHKTWKNILSLISTITKSEWSKGQFVYIQILDANLKHQISLDISNIWVTQLCIQDAKFSFKSKKLGNNWNVWEKQAKLIFYYIHLIICFCLAALHLFKKILITK